MPKPSTGNSLDTDMPLMITGQNQLTVDELMNWNGHSRDYSIVQCIGEQGKSQPKIMSFQFGKEQLLFCFQR